MPACTYQEQKLNIKRAKSRKISNLYGFSSSLPRRCLFSSRLLFTWEGGVSKQRRIESSHREENAVATDTDSHRGTEFSIRQTRWLHLRPKPIPEDWSEWLHRLIAKTNLSVNNHELINKSFLFAASTQRSKLQRQNRFLSIIWAPVSTVFSCLLRELT